MSEEKWLEAARAYEQKSKEVLQAPQTATATAVAPRPIGSSVSEIADALTKFIRSEEGSAAKRLLYASKQYITLGESREGGGYRIEYFMDHEGYKKSNTAFSTWTDDDILKPEESRISEKLLAQELVFASRSPTTAEFIMATLKNKLNAIAEKANE